MRIVDRHSTQVTPLQAADKVVNEAFFDWIVSKCHVSEVVCVTWSFPVGDKNEIITMGKGWTVHVDEPIDVLFERSFSKRGHKVHVHSVMNDTVALGTDALERGIRVSLVLGTGTNMCLSIDGELMNVELGFFGALQTPTRWDTLLDDRFGVVHDAHMNGTTPLFQPFELITSGRGLGELLRLIWDDLADDCPYAAYELDGIIFCQILRDDTAWLSAVARALLERAAYYVRSALIAGLNIAGDGAQTVCYNGGFLTNCPEYRELITQDSYIELIQ